MPYFFSIFLSVNAIKKLLVANNSVTSDVRMHKNAYYNASTVTYSISYQHQERESCSYSPGGGGMTIVWRKNFGHLSKVKGDGARIVKNS